MSTNTTKITRDAKLKWVPIADMLVSPMAQRDLNQAWVDRIAADFSPEEVGAPTVNFRDGHYYIIDGQHRVNAMMEIGWADQQIKCFVYEGLSEREEAEKFLVLNAKLNVTPYAKFNIGVQAGRPIEVDIEKIVRAEGLVISNTADGIKAVGALRKVYDAGGGPVLSRALAITRDSYGTAGLKGEVIEGLGLVCQRYNGQLDDGKAVSKLSGTLGGVNGLLGKAEVLRRQTGNSKVHCVAAAAVEIINGGRGGGGKLQSWWKA